MTALRAAIGGAEKNPRIAGFTLIELMVALLLLALISSILYGSLSLSATSWDRGEAKAETDGRAGRKSLELILGIYESAKTGRDVPIPLVTRH